jgi:DNA-binding MarR family transcriptional regulator
MTDTVLIGEGNAIITMPRTEWEGHLRAAPERMKERLAFMTPEHHAVRRFVVAELPRHGRPITPATIAQKLGLAASRVKTIIDELEKALFFVVRTNQQDVSWAFPVTVEATPHALSFSTGERCYAA